MLPKQLSLELKVDSLVSSFRFHDSSDLYQQLSSTPGDATTTHAILATKDSRSMHSTSRLSLAKTHTL